MIIENLHLNEIARLHVHGVRENIKMDTCYGRHRKIFLESSDCRNWLKKGILKNGLSTQSSENYTADQPLISELRVREA